MYYTVIQDLFILMCLRVFCKLGSHLKIIYFYFSNVPPRGCSKHLLINYTYNSLVEVVTNHNHDYFSHLHIAQIIMLEAAYSPFRKLSLKILQKRKCYGLCVSFILCISAMQSKQTTVCLSTPFHSANYNFIHDLQKQ